MTFVQEVREELSRLEGETPGEAEYEWYGARLACGGDIRTRRITVARRFLALGRRHPQRFGECLMRRERDARFGGEDAFLVLAARPVGPLPAPETLEHASAMARGAFLARGAVSDPESRYHADVAVPDEAAAREMETALDALMLPARTSSSRGRYIVYLKSGDAVCEFLGRIGASSAYMKMESARVMKEMRGGVNRQVNCDSANIGKTQRASEAQRDVIERIERVLGLEKLPGALADIARLRLEYADASLEELGALCDPPLQKSGVNSRMRRLLAIGAKLGES